MKIKNDEHELLRVTLDGAFIGTEDGKFTLCTRYFDDFIIFAEDETFDGLFEKIRSMPLDKRLWTALR